MINFRKNRKHKQTKIDTTRQNAEQQQIENVFFIVGLICIIMIAILIFIGSWKGFSILNYVPPCAIHTLTGLYCPGCGGTRATVALLHGEIWKSFLYHPIVLYTLLVGGTFMLTQSIERISGHRIKCGMHYRNAYLWIALGIVIANCIVKNYFLIAFGRDLLNI